MQERQTTANGTLYIERILRGERILMIQRTGFCKSLYYQFPATQFKGVTVIHDYFPDCVEVLCRVPDPLQAGVLPEDDVKLPVHAFDGPAFADGVSYLFCGLPHPLAVYADDLPTDTMHDGRQTYGFPMCQIGKKLPTMVRLRRNICVTTPAFGHPSVTSLRSVFSSLLGKNKQACFYTRFVRRLYQDKSNVRKA